MNMTEVLTKKHNAQGGRAVPADRLTFAHLHPACEAFPEMSAAELQELADDIKSNGLTHAIVRDADGRILDGRNRMRACEIAAVEPRFETYKGDNPIAYVISANLKRRHLNESQRALVAARLAKIEHGSNRAPSGKFAGRSDVPTQAAAAAMLNISERSVRDAAVVRDCGSPELIRAVETGEVSVSAAAKQAKPPNPRTKPSPKPKPRRAIHLRHVNLVRDCCTKVEDASVAGDEKRYRFALERLARIVAQALQGTK
jgi:hypothetical protein